MVATVAVVCLAAVGGFSVYQDRQVRFADRLTNTRSVVQTARGVVTHFGDLERDGTLTRSEVQRQALAVLKALRYGNGDYFWVNTVDAHMVTHPIKPALDGTDVSGMKTPTASPCSSGSGRS